MSNIGFIGLGNMGGPMAANLVKAGERVLGFDLVEASRAGVGARRRADRRQRAGDASRTPTSSSPCCRPASTCCRCGTTSCRRRGRARCSSIARPSTSTSARKAHALAAARGIATLDAPVSGGVGGAKAATLTFMVGGTATAFARGKPVLERMGKRVVHCGEAGNGQAAKICNNMILGISMIAVSEAFVLGEKLGLSHQALVRRRLGLLRPMLVADQLLPGAGPGARKPGQQRLQARLRRGLDAQGPQARPDRPRTPPAPTPHSAPTPSGSTSSSRSRATPAPISRRSSSSCASSRGAGDG